MCWKSSSMIILHVIFLLSTISLVFHLIIYLSSNVNRFPQRLYLLFIFGSRMSIIWMGYIGSGISHEIHVYTSRNKMYKCLKKKCTKVVQTLSYLSLITSIFSRKTTNLLLKLFEQLRNHCNIFWVDGGKMRSTWCISSSSIFGVDTSVNPKSITILLFRRF